MRAALAVIAIVAFAGAGLYMTRATPEDIEACQMATNYTAAQCEQEINS